MHTSLHSFPRCLPRARRCKKKGELVESQCSNAADLKVMKMFESPSSHGLLYALTERGEAHLFSQVPVSNKRNQPTPGLLVSSHTGQLLTVTCRLCAVSDGVCAPRKPPLSRRSSAFCHSCSLLAHWIKNRHGLCMPDTSCCTCCTNHTVLQGVHTSNMHTEHGGTQNWAKSYAHTRTDAERRSEQPYCIYLLENSHLKVYNNPLHAMSPSTDVHAQTLSPGFLCRAVSGVAECAWSVSQIYHIPGLYPDPFNEVSNVSVHVSISSGMSDK